ncbi:hypothetical protein H5410_027920 [Solanum commersonii]|uniref:F-box family protein n=1 Tax=Solanum commersonii TaxID=4109 RepID=A0A9J5Z4R7_SOLCO|nr:hypothetical protein H5410_027920 [Solanum commersonii]
MLEVWMLSRSDVQIFSLSSSKCRVLGWRLSAFLANRCVSGWLGIWIMKEYSVKEPWMMMFSVKPYSATRFNDGKKFQSGKSPRFLCMLKSGEILLDYDGSINA